MCWQKIIDNPPLLLLIWQPARLIFSGSLRGFMTVGSRVLRFSDIDLCNESSIVIVPAAIRQDREGQTCKFRHSSACFSVGQQHNILR